MNETEIDTPSEEVEAPTGSPVRKVPKTLEGMLAAITQMVKGGQITTAQARQFRGNLGISKSYFTKKQVSPAKRKAKRIAAKKARAVTRNAL